MFTITFTEAHTSVCNEPTVSNGMVHLVVFGLRKGLALVRRMDHQRTKREETGGNCMEQRTAHLPCLSQIKRAGTPPTRIDDV
jgi:hypothetical protein